MSSRASVEATAAVAEIAAHASLYERLGYRFVEPALLELALTHRSWASEHGGVEHNERLEFLGDSVLGVIVTDHLYHLDPHLAEGAMAKARAAVVSAEPLARVAASLDIGDHVRLGKGELATGGRSKPSILADALEAVIGAVYLDGGWPPAARLVLHRFGSLLAEAAMEPGRLDFKTRLQEEIAARFEDVAPHYAVNEEGPDHDKRFTALVSVAGDVLGIGAGKSKKQAQQAAARAAWDSLIDTQYVTSDSDSLRR